MIQTNNLGEKNSLLNHFIRELRDTSIQNDSMRFRRNLERIGEIFAYEISKNLHFKEKEVTTPLGIIDIPLITDKLVLATILRAGLPFHQGLLNLFDNAENAFITSYRQYEKDGTFIINTEHVSAPDLDGKTIILSDPMLATGSSLVHAIRGLIEHGFPGHIHIATIIASPEGINKLHHTLDYEKTTLWVGAIDDELTSKSYIVPGLGDAGDLAYGSKSMESADE